MRFTINKQDFQDGINAASRIAYNKTQKSILECILIEAKDNSVVLNAFDTVTAIETSIYAEVSEEGACAIPSRLLFDVITKMNGGEVIVEDKNEKGVMLTCAETCVVLQKMDEKQFPRFPEIKGSEFEIEAKTLNKLIEKTIFSVYTQPDKPIFTGLLFEITGDILNVVGIDGVRLAKMTVRKPESENIRIVIPSKALKEVSRLSEESKNKSVRMVMQKAACFFVTDEYRIYTRLIEGEFMNYNNIIPNSFKTRVRVNVKMLESSLNMVSVMSKSMITNPVKLSMSFDNVEISAKSEYGDATDIVPIKLQGENMSISLNAKYMLDVLRVIEDEDIYIDMENNLKPCVIRSVDSDEYMYLIIPLNMKD